MGAKVLDLGKTLYEPWGDKIASSEMARLAGVYFHPRQSRDFPEVTPGHYVVSRILKGVNLAERSSDSFPNATGGHAALTYLSIRDIEKAPNFVDLGCGVGFLGTFFGKNSRLNNLIFSDLSPSAIEHAKNTVKINSSPNTHFKTRLENISFIEGNAKETIKGLDGGIAVCSPYLIPEVCTVFPGVYGLFGEIAKSNGMDLYIGHSNLAESLVGEAAEKNGMPREEVLRMKDFLLTPEYSNGEIPKQLAQARENKLFPGTVSKLKELGLKEKDGRYYHDWVVTKLSGK